jgi:hypothetical protein
MRFHLTTEGHIRTSNEPESADADAAGGTFASERELQELACAWPMKRLVEIGQDTDLQASRAGLYCPLLVVPSPCFRKEIFTARSIKFGIQAEWKRN